MLSRAGGISARSGGGDGHREGSAYVLVDVSFDLGSWDAAVDFEEGAAGWSQTGAEFGVEPGDLFGA